MAHCRNVTRLKQVENEAGKTMFFRLQRFLKILGYYTRFNGRLKICDGYNLFSEGRLMTSLEISAKAMNQLYLNTNFLNRRVMLFFELKTNRKLILFFFLSALFFASCSPAKKIRPSRGRASAPKVDVTKHKPNDIDIKLKEPDNSLKHPERDKKTESEDKAEKVISTARTFIGTPYKYGGTTRSGMDCSALLINSFSAVKVNLPRSSEAQSKVGTEIKMDELRPGDLVFFATGNKKKEITHVGLITDVKSKDNIKFIHASSSLGVVETNLLAEYYQKRFRVARRVID